MFKYDKITDKLVRELFKTVETIPNQRKGSSADYIIDNTYCLEVKYDTRAESTGNIFVEYATQKNEEEPVPSGIALSAKNDYDVLYLIPTQNRGQNRCRAYQLPAVKLLELAITHGKKRKTRPNVNGNRDGFFGLGYILSLEVLEEYEKGVIFND